MFVCRQHDIMWLQTCIHQTQRIRNTIENSDDFYNAFFHNKTEDEIKQWIEKEAQRWMI